MFNFPNVQYRLWLDSLGEIIERKHCNTQGWKSWDDWQAYFDDGMTPKEAYDEAHRTV